MSKNKTKVNPLGDRVLVKPLEEKDTEKKTDSGIILPESSKDEAVKRGTVISVGVGKKNDEGEVISMEVKDGDKILFKEFSGEKVNIDDEEYYIVSESGLLAIIN